MKKTLKDIEVGKSAVIKEVGGSGSLRQHLMDMGVLPETEVTVVKLAPMNDPMEVELHGYELTLRVSEAEQIIVEPCERRERRRGIHKHTAEGFPESHRFAHRRRGRNHFHAGHPDAPADHPGLGEEGKFHKKGDGSPLPRETKLTFALVGNQNSGKTTLFNLLTGANQHVGNFPGVTVDRKDGAIRGYANTTITDLPGIYSMSPYSSEEIVSRNFVIEEQPKAIINIVDATNLARSLYLSLQLLEMDIPMVIVLNMMDEVTGNGGFIDVNAMEAMLGVPVVPISAAKNEGIEELVRHALHIAQNQEKPKRLDFCGIDDHGGAVHRAIHAASHLLADHAERAKLPARFAATKALEGDPLILEQLKLQQNEREMLEHIVTQMEAECGLDRNAAIAAMRYEFIEKLCEQTESRPPELRERVRSERIDRVLTGKYTAIPCFVAIMMLVFYLTFNVIGAFLQNALALGIDALGGALDSALTAAEVNSTLHSLIIDGIFAGVGSVLSFLPIIVTLFFFLSMLEDSGYIARVAFVMDKLLRRLGLSGRSIVPMLIGFGCTVPAVMATRTLPSERDRKMTIMLTPFLSCSAKLPIYSFFVSAFFPHNGGWIISALYFLGIIVGILIALLFKHTLFRGEAVPFVMELPNYRLPGAKNVLRLLWEKSKDFLQRAFSVILIATIVVWFLQSFDLRGNLIANSQDSILAALSGKLEGIFRPLGLGDWRIVTALICGFMAKESVVSTLEVLFAGAITSALTPLSAAALLVFCLLYTPCVAAVAAIRRELGGSWALCVTLAQCAVAWVVAYAVRLIGLMLGGI